MDRNQLDGLIALKLIAEKKNFTAAADELGITPPAISKMIKQLESKLGVSLLARTTRSMSLTEAGERFLNDAGPALDQILAAMDNVGSYAQKPSGLLRLNLPRAVCPTIFPIISSFIKKYPDVSIELYFEDAVSDVVEKGFDAGIRLSDILAKDMVAVKLYGPVKFVTSASPKYLNKMGRPKHPKDLLQHNCIRFKFESGYMYDRWEFESKGKEFQVQIKGSLIMNDPLILKNACVDGHGVMYTSYDSIEDLVKSGKLEVILEQYAAKSEGFYLYYPKRSQVMPKLRAFIDHIKNNLHESAGSKY